MRPGAGASARLDLRLALPAVAAWAGAWLGLGIPLPIAAAACIAGTVFGVRAWSLRSLPAASLCLGLVSGVAVAGLRVVALYAGPIDELATQRAAATVDLVVTGDPRRHAARNRGAERGRELFVVPARAEQVAARGRVVRIRSPVLVLATDPTWGRVLPGQRLVAAGRLSPARPRQPVAAVLKVPGVVSAREPPPLIQRVAGGLRAGLRRAVDGLPPGERGLVPGLVLGDTGRMPPALTDDFRTAGLTHLTAVSGANLAIVCGFFLYVGRWAGVRGRSLAVLGVMSLAGFVVLARAEPSVLRAAVMGLVGLVALASGRRRGGVAALAAAVLGLLLIDPWLARSYGFALSVLATAGLLVLAPGWADALHARRVPLLLAHALAVPAAAHVACAPVVAMLSGQVSLVAVLANLLVAPAIAPATVVGVLATLVGAGSDRGAEILGRVAGIPASWVVTVAEHAAAFPLAAISWPASVPGAASLGLLAAVLLVGLRWAGRRRHALALLVAGVLVAAGVTAASPGWPPEGWLLVACDVGQGDALVLSGGHAGAVVIDAGPDPRLVDQCLRDLGVQRIGVVLVTHLHADHVEGLRGVLRGRSVGQVQVGLYDEPSPALRRVRSWAAQADVPMRRVAVGERYRLGRLSWEVLWPARVIEGDGSVPNNASVVVLADVAGVRMLLTGDVEPPAQRAIIAQRRLGTVDVLKVAHHGSAAQEPELLQLTRPRLAVVSAGEGNDYGHPAASTLRDLLRSGAVVGRTDRDGAVAVVGPVEQLRLVVAGR